MKDRSFSITSCARRIYDQQVFALIDAERISAPLPHATSRHAERVELGRGRLLARLAERNQRMDLSALARRAGTHDATRAKISERNRLARNAPSNKPRANCSSRNPAIGHSSCAPAPVPITPANASKIICFASSHCTSNSPPEKSTKPGSRKSKRWTIFFQK